MPPAAGVLRRSCLTKALLVVQHHGRHSLSVAVLLVQHSVPGSGAAPPALGHEQQQLLLSRACNACGKGQVSVIIMMVHSVHRSGWGCQQNFALPVYSRHMAVD